MIEFIEKEPYYDDSPFAGQCHMYPTYMVKDGVEYFMFNHREPDDSWKLREQDEHKKQLIETDGAYFKFNGFYADPFEMLREIAARKHHFTQPTDLYWASIEERRFLDFHGNRREVSAAFHYRIYSPELAAKIREAAEHINREEWDKV